MKYILEESKNILKGVIDKGKNEVDHEVIKVKFDRINGEYIYKLDTLIHG